uniref:Uncharacterized protein n=1 Tax=Utricularia reniformis TaxID=192314 RepID=A0A1Y0AZE3_9LAMI|nr:hypothetical protein AEK19_MT0220 [Utricularia reniformis]ART30498.1 hypothetical protein AEK19_MT0220 [Utricularia reniformis]
MFIGVPKNAFVKEVSSLAVSDQPINYAVLFLLSAQKKYPYIYLSIDRGKEPLFRCNPQSYPDSVVS